MTTVRKVLSILAHPDDAEFMCAGTLALLKQKGWEVHIATMTPETMARYLMKSKNISFSHADQWDFLPYRPNLLHQ